jgi:NAD-dependent dihydropyrimidine dehydrogenase PreA subunit
MSGVIKSSEKNPVLAEKPKGLNYRAVIDSEKCSASGECIKSCEVEAIREGPKRFPRFAVLRGKNADVIGGLAAMCIYPKNMSSRRNQ